MTTDATDQKSLWKVLNDQRTQGEIETWESDNLFYLRKVESGFIIGEIPDKEDADYATLAVNNLHILAEALEGFIKKAQDHHSIYFNDELKAAKEALKRIS